MDEAAGLHGLGNTVNVLFEVFCVECRWEIP